jgi:transcriptional regulator with XRE-family HTH domain
MYTKYDEGENMIQHQQLRESMGLSQEKFALKIEMERTYYSSVEAGKRNISINIQKIADGLGKSLSELFLSVEQCKED